MDLKLRLQRVLQILEDAEGAGALSDLEKDIVLGELREAYTEVKFGETQNEEPQPKEEEQKIAPIVPVAPVEEEQADDEPEVEVELLFEEEAEETENGELKTENEEQEQAEEPEQEQEQAEEPEVVPVAPEVPATTAEVPATPAEAEPAKSENNDADEELSSFVSRLSPKKSSPLLSLYDDEPKPVLGEQFHEKPSVADTIACPKGVAESAPVSSLRKAIGVADRFMIIRELFDGDGDAYDRAMDALDSQRSFDDCVIYISENFAWRSQSEATKFVMELLQRKFNE